MCYDIIFIGSVSYSS